LLALGRVKVDSLTEELTVLLLEREYNCGRTIFLRETSKHLAPINLELKFVNATCWRFTVVPDLKSADTLRLIEHHSDEIRVSLLCGVRLFG
jgi:hypothetical protein